MLAVIWLHGRQERYALFWCAGFAVALLLMPLMGPSPPPHTLVTGFLATMASTLYNLAFYLLAHGAALYAGQRFAWRRWFSMGAMVAVVTAVTLARGDAVLRELVNGSFVLAACGAGVLSIWRVRPRRMAEWTMIAAFLGAALMMAFFLADVVITRPADTYALENLGNQVAWLAQPVLVVTFATGAVAAALSRLVRQLAAERGAAEAVAEQARAADRAKSEFLATISHEIRTPINAIQGCLQILETHNLNAAQIRLLEVMGGSSATLLSLIDDVLDMAKLEAGRLEMVSGPVDLGLLLGDLMASVGPRAERKGLVLSLRTGDGVPSGVVTDGKRLRQILLCLLDNAVKFTERGQVTLSVDRVASPPRGHASASKGKGDAHWVRFQVTDTGIGIPADKLEQIFNVFNQADNSISRRFGGTGLGLAIARSLTDMLGGVLTVDSGPEQGSEFSLCLPLVALTVQQPDTPPRMMEPAAMTSTMVPVADLYGAGLGERPVILLVEDDEMNRLVTTELLVRYGAEVMQAANGAEALSIVRRRPVDAVVMDLSMPEMDGLETARRLRSLPGSGGRVPIVALSANLTADIRQQCRDAGIQAFLPKPFRLEDVGAALSSVLSRMSKPAA
ncbi:ATP-binding protein [Niveispirillum fermenti]|uniref:ATP-binding protein n=1 Tax=Niveispirillum fermenti TaxID=1233113 RepID=UPI003A8A8420